MISTTYHVCNYNSHSNQYDQAIIAAMVKRNDDVLVMNQVDEPGTSRYVSMKKCKALLLLEVVESATVFSDGRIYFTLVSGVVLANMEYLD